MLFLNVLNKYLLILFIFDANINFLCKTHEHTYHSLVKLEKNWIVIDLLQYLSFG